LPGEGDRDRDADTGEGHGEARAVGGHPEVAVERELAPSRYGVSLDGRDSGVRAALEELEGVLEGMGLHATRLPLGGELAEVEAGAEGLPGACDHDRTHVAPDRRIPDGRVERVD